MTVKVFCFISVLTRGNKLIFDHPVEGLDREERVEFNEEWCKKNYSCLLSAWNDQLTDRILISNPFKTPYSGAMAFTIMSPVYLNGKLVGEFGEQVYLNSLYQEGKAIDVNINNGYKHILLFFLVILGHTLRIVKLTWQTTIT